MDLRLLLLVFSSCLNVGYTQNCEDWVSIPPANYNRTFVQINSPTANQARPVGFQVATLTFEDQTPPCYVVSNTAGNDRHIEIKWEFALTATLCIRNNFMLTPECSTGQRNRICADVPNAAPSVTYTFLCTGGNCESGDRQFWFRFLVEEPGPDGQFDENWCSNDDSLYPSALSQIPSITPPTTTATTSGSATTMASFLLVLLSSFCSVLF